MVLHLLGQQLDTIVIALASLAAVFLLKKLNSAFIVPVGAVIGYLLTFL